MAAWHAGRRYNPTWRLIKDTPNPNFYTIGIEHEGEAERALLPARPAPALDVESTPLLC